MNDMNLKRNILISAVLVLLVVVGRLIPHVWNVTPVVAVTLLAGAILPRWWAVAVPAVAMLASDLIIGFYHMPVMLTVYASLVAMIFLGLWLAQPSTVSAKAESGTGVSGVSPSRVILASLASSTFFFITTNFAVWASAAWYPKTLDGLMLAYTLGLPFFRNMIIGDVIFSGVVFGAWVMVNKAVQYRKVYLNNIISHES